MEMGEEERSVNVIYKEEGIRASYDTRALSIYLAQGTGER